MRARIYPLAAVCGILVSAAAYCASMSTTLLVTATVVSACAVRTSPLAFGVYDAAGFNAVAPLDGVGTLTLTCGAGGPAATIGVMGSFNPGRGPTALAMKNGSNSLQYAIYKDPDHEQVWSGAGSGAVTIPPAGSAEPRRIPIYGRIPPGQNVPPGAYIDLAVISIVF